MYKVYDLKLGYSCNNRCRHCVIEDSKLFLLSKNMPIDINTTEAINLLKEQIRNGIDAVTITGGEPTIRKDLSEILEFCSDNRLQITLQTNGRLLSEKCVQEMVFKHSGIVIVVALHGVTPLIHDAITQVNGSFDQTMAGIRAARKRNISVIIKTVISKENVECLPDFIPFMVNEKLRDINVAFPHAQGAARINFESVVPRYQQLKPYLGIMAKMAKKACINLSFETIPFCILPSFPEMMSELVYGGKDVKCTQVCEETFDWNKTRKQIKRKSPVCSYCFFNNYCEGPWEEYVEKYGFSEFVPIVIQKRR